MNRRIRLVSGSLALSVPLVFAFGCGGPGSTSAPPAPEPAPAQKPGPEPPGKPDIGVDPNNGFTIGGNAVTGNTSLNGLNQLSPKAFGNSNGMSLLKTDGTSVAVTSVTLAFSGGNLTIAGSAGQAYTWTLGSTQQTAYNASSYGNDRQWPANLVVPTAGQTVSYVAGGTASTIPMNQITSITVTFQQQ